MLNFGLLGHEYDESIQLLKRRLEDRGHRAKILNLTHLPRTIQTTLTPEILIFDGHDLREYDCFYLTDLGLREPFFHVKYEPELWAALRPRYLKFASGETASVHLAVDLVNLLAHIRPMVNPPHIYSYRLHYPFPLHRLSSQSIKVPAFVAAPKRPDGYDESVPLNLDEYKYWEVLSFSKTGRTDLKCWCIRPVGAIYKVFVLGKRLMEEALSMTDTGQSMRLLPLAEVPATVAETAMKAAAELDIAFGEITCVNDNGTIWLSDIDPLPDIKKLEDVHNFHVSSALADYLIDTAANAKK